MTTASFAASALPESIRRTLFNTFVAVGVMWLLTACASYVAMDWRLDLWGSLGLFAGSLGALFGVFVFRNSGLGLGLLAGFAVLEGLSLGPLLSHYLAMPGGAAMVSTAAGLTALATFGCAMYCVVSRRSFSRWGGFLFAGLMVLLGASLIALFYPVPALMLTISVVGSVLFTAYLLYDISRVVTGEETNYITAAVSVFLDMLNLMLSLLRLLGLLGSDD